MAKRINRLKLPSSNVFLANTPKNVYPVPGDDALEEINSPEDTTNTEEQAAKYDNTAEPAAGFGIKISSIASIASDNQEEGETGTKDDEDTGADKEPTAGFGIKVSSIASTASESLEEEETTEKDGNKQPLETSGVSLQLSDSDNEKSLNKSSKETEEPREGN